MEKILNENIIYIIGMLVSIAAISAIIVALTVVIFFKKNKHIKVEEPEKDISKNEFEFLTPVILKKIEYVTKVVERKEVKIDTVKEEHSTKNNEQSIDDISEKIEEQQQTESVDSANKKTEKERTSERYKIESRFLKDPNDK